MYKRCCSFAGPIKTLTNPHPPIKKLVKTSPDHNKMLPSSLFLLLCVLFPFSNSQTFLQILPENTSSGHPIVGDAPVLAYCESWRLSVETNNAGNWKKIPSRCHDAIESYINGPQYVLDSKVAARHANSYAKSIKVAADKKDAWVFDVDETLISNVQLYIVSGYGYCIFVSAWIILSTTCH